MLRSLYANIGCKVDVMRGNKGFRNQAKSGAKASLARWRQAAAKAEQHKVSRSRRLREPRMKK